MHDRWLLVPGEKGSVLVRIAILQISDQSILLLAAELFDICRPESRLLSFNNCEGCTAVQLKSYRMAPKDPDGAPARGIVQSCSTLGSAPLHLLIRVTYVPYTPECRRSPVFDTSFSKYST
jgi:hypothetical protein